MMVDSLSGNMAASHAAASAALPASLRPEPAIQVTETAAGRNGGNATGRHGSPDASASGLPRKAFDEVNAAMEAWSTGMRFEIDDDTQQMVVSIVDTKSGDVLRQIPSEEVLHVAKMIAQFQGNLVSVKA